MKTIGIVWALIASVTWGLLYNIDQKILLKSSPFTLFFIVSIIELLVFLPLSRTSLMSDIYKIDRAQLTLIIISAILFIGANIAILYSVKNLTAPIASIIEISYPVFVVLFAFILFPKQEITTNVWLGGILIFIGSLIVMR